MYEFTKSDIEFLQRFGQTGNGRDLLKLLENIKGKVDSTSTIPKNSDYGAQVEGRRLTAEILDTIIKTMAKRTEKSYQVPKGVDEYH